MRYVSIDIETGGLDPSYSLLEFAAVVEDTDKKVPVSDLPSFHSYVLNKKIVGDPFALAMHQKILQRISKQEEPWKYTDYEDLERCFVNFLGENGFDSGYGNIEINVAGKNFAMFDANFLELAFRSKSIRFFRRVIDPSILFWRPEDTTLPSSETCLKRAFTEGVVAHTALEDAQMVVKLVRAGLLIWSSK